MRVFLPKSRRDRAHAKADQKRLNKMLSQGHLILTPSRKSDGALWSSFDCNEEDYIVRYAAQREAVIVSTRRFEDFEEPRLQEQVGQSLSGHFPPVVTFPFIVATNRWRDGCWCSRSRRRRSSTHRWTRAGVEDRVLRRFYTSQVRTIVLVLSPIL